MLELAEMIWKKIHCERKPFRYVCENAYKYDVQERSPDTRKAAQMLGFYADTPLDKILDEVVPWIEEQIRVGQI